MVLLAGIEKIDQAFYEVQGDYESRTLSLVDTRDAVTMLVGQVKQLDDLITQIGGDGQLETISELEQTMQAYQTELTQALAQSAVKTRVTQKKGSNERLA